MNIQPTGARAPGPNTEGLHLVTTKYLLGWSQFSVPGAVSQFWAKYLFEALATRGQTLFRQLPDYG